MTRDTLQRMQALALAFVLTLSAVGGPVALAGTAVAEHGNTNSDVNNLSPNDIVWQGQVVVLTDSDHPYDPNETIQLREETADGTEFVGEHVVNDDGSLVLDTSNLPEGDYYFVGENGTTVYPSQSGNRAPFEVVQHNLTVDSPDEAGNDGSSAFTEVNVTVDSNRAPGEYGLVITEQGDDLTAEEIAGIIPTAEVVDGEAVITPYEGGDLTANFSGVDAGTYTFDVSARDSTANDTFQITVNERGTGEAVLARDRVEAQQGGVAAITVEFTDAQRDGTVIVGDYEEVGYEAELYVDAQTDVEEVTILVNTYTAGTGADAYSLENPENATLLVRNETMISSPDEDVLDATNYPIETSIGRETGSPDDVGTLAVTPLAIDGVEPYIAPSDASYEDAEAIQTALDEGTLTERQSVANGDSVVYAFDAASLEGVFATYDGSDDEAFQKAVNDGVFAFTLEQTDESTQINTQPKTVDLSQTRYEVVHDADANRVYVVMDTDDIEFKNRNAPVQPGDVYGLNVSVTGDRLLQGGSPDEYAVITETAVEERSVTFPDDLTVRPATGQTITVETNIAPGSEVTLGVEATESTPRILQSAPTTVDVNGHITGTFDFSEVSNGTEFTAQLTGPEDNTYDTTGTVDALDPASLTVTDVTLPEGNLTPGQTYEVAFTVENTGEQAGSTDYSLSVAGTSVADSSVEVDGGASETVTVEFTAPNTTDVSAAYEFVAGNDTRSGDFTVVAQDDDNQTDDDENTNETPDNDDQQDNTPTDDNQTDDSNNTTDDDSTGASGPGFGIFVAVGAIAAAVIIGLGMRD